MRSRSHKLEYQSWIFPRTPLLMVKNSVVANALYLPGVLMLTWIQNTAKKKGGNFLHAIACVMHAHYSQ